MSIELVVAKVDLLKAILAKVPVECEHADVGATGYLDGRITPTASAMRGTDRHGRVFLTLCVRSVERDARGSEETRIGIVTIFQRYNNSMHIVTQANNTHGAPRLLEAGAATASDLTALDELVRTGRVTRAHEGTVGSPLLEHVEIVTPEEAIAASAANIGEKRRQGESVLLSN